MLFLLFRPMIKLNSYCIHLWTTITAELLWWIRAVWWDQSAGQSLKDFCVGNSCVVTHSEGHLLRRESKNFGTACKTVNQNVFWFMQVSRSKGGANKDMIGHDKTPPQVNQKYLVLLPMSLVRWRLKWILPVIFFLSFLVVLLTLVYIQVVLFSDYFGCYQNGG